MALAQPGPTFQQLFLDDVGDFAEFVPVDGFVEGYLDALLDEQLSAHSLEAFSLGDLDTAGAVDLLLPDHTPDDHNTSSGSVEHNSGTTSGTLPATFTASQPVDTQAAKAGGGSDQSTKGKKEKKKRWKNRTPEQYLANKRSQLKYREKVKAKNEELARSAAELEQKAADLERAKAEQVALQDKASYLQDGLHEKDAELQQLLTCVPAMRISDASRPKFNELCTGYYNQYKELKALLETADLAGNPLAFVDPAAEGRCRALLQGLMELCKILNTMVGPDLEELLHTSVEMWSSLIEGWEKDSADRWRGVVRALNVTPEQAQGLLAVRKRWLQNYEQIYIERQSLNLQLVGQMLPSLSQRPQAAADASTATAALQLMHQLDENLRREQRAVSQQDYDLFIGHLLTPAQGALMLVHCFPEHCDCLALVNALHELHEDGS